MLRVRHYTLDAYGNLIQVQERDGSGADYLTHYTYDVFNRLVRVEMPRHGYTQVRTWEYNEKQQLYRVTMPETGQTTYEYNPDGTLLRKTDAKGQKVEYAYDSLKRVISRTPKWSNGTIDYCAITYYYYDSNPIDGSFSLNAQGRVAAVRHGIPSSCPVPVGGAIEEYSYNQAGLVTNKRLRSYMSGQEGVVSSSYNYDNEGKQTSGAGGMTYDSMGRPFSGGGVTSVTYGPGDEPLQIVYGNNNYVEHRTYNLLGQVTRQTYKYWSTVLADFEYAYVDGANNGRISRFKDWVTGEEVNYLYDSLNRLNRAETTGPEWGQSFTYDGFGNLTAETATKGVAPSYTLQYDWATNRIVSPGFAYDANGNLTTIPGVGTASYDVLNRYHDYYGRLYRDDNKLLSRLVGTSREVYYYGPTGLLETVWSWTTSSDGGYTFRKVREYNYFAGRRVEMGRLTDRLGSVRAVVSTIPPTMRLASYSYYPYGQERQVTSDEQYKFATYFRESNGLDYADQRYYHSEWGRFLTPDPYQASAGPEDPASWNRYSYVRNDPINRADPSGLDDISAEFGNFLFQITVTALPPSFGGGGGGGLRVSTPSLEMHSDSFDYPGSVASAVPAAGPRNTSWERALKAATDAAKRIAKKKWKKDCEEVLIALGTSGAAISEAAAHVQFLDGTKSTEVVASLYANTPLAKSLDERRKSTEIRDFIVIEEGGKGKKALAELNGSKIYLNPKWWANEYFDDMATVLHELIHNVTGLTDADFENRGYEDLSNVLKAKCF